MEQYHCSVSELNPQDDCLMERTLVSSTSIRSVGYDSQSQILEIEFVHGGIYQCPGVPSHVYEGLMNSSSKGRYFNENIRGRY